MWAYPIWNHKYDLRPKLHDMKFNYHFITAILKSQYQYFIDQVAGKVEKKGCYISFCIWNRNDAI